MDYDLMIQHGDKIFRPAVEEDISWETERKGSPGKLSFKILVDSQVEFSEGDAVRFEVNGNKVFYGFLFQQKRDKEGSISISAYDQLRYLKNKDTYVYTNKTATEVVRFIAEDFQLQCGYLTDTKYKIASRVEDNQSLFDIIQTALDLTLQSKGEIYVLYDDFGNLSLKNIGDMRLDILLDDNTVENFDYTSSIDGDTYNKIKLTRENEESGKREVYIAQDSANINQWGVLQYYDTIEENVNGRAKADALLKLYNQKTRNLSVKGAFGDVRARAGALIPVSLDLGDTMVRSYMMVEQAKHTFSEELHTMDLTLVGGDFIA